MEAKFALGQSVKITVSGETGEIIGRAKYSEHVYITYLVRYKAGDGRAVEIWWNEPALSPNESPA